MLRRLFLQWFWDTYDALGRLVVLNLLVFTLLLALTMFLFVPALSVLTNLYSANPAFGALVSLVVFTLGGSLVLTLWFPGLLYFAWQVSQDKEFSLKDFLRGLRRRGGRFLRLSLLACAVISIVGVNAAFYSRDPVFQGGLRLVGACLAGLCFWLDLVLIGVFVNTMPLVVRDDRSVKSALKLGTFITLRYPFYTFGALAFLGLLWVLSFTLLKTAPLWVLGLAATVTYVNSMHDVVIWWEEKQSKDKANAQARAAGKPTSWKQIQQDEEAEETPHDRYQRTLRDVLKPWE